MRRGMVEGRQSVSTVGSSWVLSLLCSYLVGLAKYSTWASTSAAVGVASHPCETRETKKLTLPHSPSMQVAFDIILVIERCMHVGGWVYL